MAHAAPVINLLKKNRKSLLDIFINWALTLGRAVVIITEGIALLAFLYRFSLDRQLIDLHGKIKQEQAIIALSKKNESQFREIHDRLSLTNTLEKKSDELTKVFEDVLAMTPKDLSFNTVSLSQNSITLDANVLSIASLAKFIADLKSYPSIRIVSLDRLENKTTNGVITVTITAGLATQKNKP